MLAFPCPLPCPVLHLPLPLACRSLGAAISKHPNLCEVAIGGAMRYKLGDDGLAAIGRSIRNCLRLSRLDLSVTGLTDGAGMAALAASVGANNRLRMLDLSGDWEWRMDIQEWWLVCGSCVVGMLGKVVKMPGQVNTVVC